MSKPSVKRYDSIWKYLFSRKPFLRDLLLNFIAPGKLAPANIGKIDFLPTNFVKPDASQKLCDLLARIDIDGKPSFFYMLMEFQRKIERDMPMRMADYILQAQKVAQRGLKRIPPVLPVVIYNGDRPWRAPRQMNALYAPMPDWLGEYQLQLKYHLFDMRNGAEEPLDLGQSPVSFLLQSERDVSLRNLIALLNVIKKRWIAPGQAEVRDALLNYLSWVFNKNPEHVEVRENFQLEDLEMQTRHATYWYDLAWDEGMEEGRKEGREEERTSLFLSFHSQLGKLVSERFGQFPHAWQALLDKITDPAVLLKLAQRINEADSVEDYELFLRQAAGQAQ